MTKGIALIPNSSFINFFISLQKILRTFCPITPILGRKQNLPHLTLLQGIKGTDDEIRDKFYKLINDSTIQKRINIEFGEIKYYVGNWIFWLLKKEDNIINLHNKTFELFKNHLYPPIKYDKKYIANYSEIEMNNFLQYDYRFIGNAYLPHITLGRLKCKNIEEIQLQIRKFIFDKGIDLKQQFEYLTLYSVGKDGSHEITLESYKI